MTTATASQPGTITINLTGITAANGDTLTDGPATLTMSFPTPADAHAFATQAPTRFTYELMTIVKVTGTSTALRFRGGRLVRHAVPVGDALTLDQLAALAR